MNNNHYNVFKDNNSHNSVHIENTTGGFNITPKNTISYDGIVVNKLVIVKQAFIEKLLKRKIKRKLELYLQFLIEFIESDSDDGSVLAEVLNDVTRYRDIINYKYRKHLGDEYVDLLLKKLELLDYELKVKMYSAPQKQADEETIGARSR